MFLSLVDQVGSQHNSCKVVRKGGSLGVRDSTEPAKEQREDLSFTVAQIWGDLSIRVIKTLIVILNNKREFRGRTRTRAYSEKAEGLTETLGPCVLCPQ